MFSERHDRQCQASLRDLFELLHTWKDRQANVELSLWFSGHTYARGEDDVRNITQEQWESLDYYQLWKTGNAIHQVYLTAEDIQKLPRLPQVTSLILLDIDTTILRPLSFFYILGRLPHVRHISGGEGGSLQPRALRVLTDQRQEVADHLLILPESAETFTFAITHNRELSLKPARDAANYLSPRGLDEFSISCRSLGLRLRELRLDKVRVSKSFFWPTIEEKVDPTCLAWPKLEVLKVLEVPPNTSDGMSFWGSNLKHYYRPDMQGKWILDNNHETDWEGELHDDSYDEWEYDLDYYARRGILKSDPVNQLYVSIGLAVQRMPRLRSLKHSFRGAVGESGSHEWLRFKRDLSTGMVTLQVNTEWGLKLEEKVICAWGLKNEKAKEFREKWSVSLERWP
ncbi:hypothetical protein N7505_007468 [Penicillium chrysogenum]|uniref:Uncharacterized protein n=1 Tax=Penicillium chrysogenum TaxID=5076 RepID=A0ABQ8WDP6_PENCH|nr:hypothetical protein N7505_007468 [Penicillium chrysogenum]